MRQHAFRLLSSLLILVLPLAALRAQSSGAGAIHGRVVRAGSSGVAIASATIDVGNVATRAPAGRVTSAADGTFRVAGLSPGQYRVIVRALGFGAKTLPVVALSASAPDVDVGVVALTEIPLELQTQAVTAQREEVQIQPDRTTYVVRDMPTTKGGTALDVLRNVPSVDVDIDNNISLRGNTGVVIQINGRPSALKGSQLGNFLDQLPADAIDHVEIIPNPSAREDADGVAGIINIVLRQKPDAGTSGSLTLGGGTTGHVDAGVNGGWQRGPLSAFGSYSLLRDNRPRYDAIFRQDSYAGPLTYLQENGTRTQIPLVHTVTGNVTYQPSDHDELSADGMYSQRREWETQGILYQTLDSALVLDDLTDRHSRDVNHEGSADAALSYKHGFAAKGHTLSSELRFEEHFEGGPTDILDQALWPMSAPATTTLQQTRTVWTHSSTTSLRVDYVQPLAHNLRLETGYRGYLERIRTTQDVANYDAAQAAMLTDPSQASDFAYDALVHDVYGMVAGAARSRAVPGRRPRRARDGDVRPAHARSAIRQSVQQPVPERARLVRARRRGPAQAVVLDPDSSARRSRSARSHAARARCAEYLRRQSVSPSGIHPRPRAGLPAHRRPRHRAAHAVLSALVRCREKYSHDRLDRRHDAELRQHRHDRLVWHRCDGCVRQWRTPQRLRWWQRVSPAKQRQQSRPEPVGEHVRLERAHEHGVPRVTRPSMRRRSCRMSDGRRSIRAGTRRARVSASAFETSCWPTA